MIHIGVAMCAKHTHFVHAQSGRGGISPPILDPPLIDIRQYIVEADLSGGHVVAQAACLVTTSFSLSSYPLQTI